MAGTSPVIAGRLDPAVLAGSGCAHVSIVPTQLRRLLSRRPAARDLGSGFRSVLLGGAAAPQALIGQARAAGIRVVTTYGMSETCGGCVYDGFPLEGCQRSATGDDGRIRFAAPCCSPGTGCGRT